MPVVQIELLEGRTVEQKRNLAAKVTKALIESIDCPADAVQIIIRDLKRENISKGGVLYIDRD